MQRFLIDWISIASYYYERSKLPHEVILLLEREIRGWSDDYIAYFNYCCTNYDIGMLDCNVGWNNTGSAQIHYGDVVLAYTTRFSSSAMQFCISYIQNR